MSPVIEASDLVKRYGDLEALRGLDLEVQEGEVFAVLGPNGAGKSTAIEILEGFRDRTSGEVSVLGTDPAEGGREWRERLGIVLQDSQVSPQLTVTEVVRMYAAYYSAPRPVADVIRLVGLGEQVDQRVGRLSGGQQRRVDLALALVGDPSLVFLDEPTTGFDPAARREAWEVVRGLRDLGVTILLTTHYMDEAQHLADRIAVISAGRVIARGTADELAEQVRSKPVVSWAGDVPDGLGVAVTGSASGWRAAVEEDELVGVVARLTSWGSEAPGRVDGLDIERPSLEDTYLSLVAEQASVEGATS